MSHAVTAVPGAPNAANRTGRAALALSGRSRASGWNHEGEPVTRTVVHRWRVASCQVAGRDRDADAGDDLRVDGSGTARVDVIKHGNCVVVGVQYDALDSALTMFYDTTDYGAVDVRPVTLSRRPQSR